MRGIAGGAFAMWLVAAGALAQQDPSAGMGDMDGMDMPATSPNQDNQQKPDTQDMPGMSGMSGMEMPSTGLLGSYAMTRDASGTSWQPDAASHQSLHAMLDDWMLMGHVRLAGVYDSQSGPRGDTQTFFEGMLMGEARRDFGGDTLNLRAMLSPDAFMGRAGYPLLLQTGETANGTTPLLDRQHPHDLFMELAASFSHRLSGDDSLFVYAGYPGEPALGPPTFMHRASGMDIPNAPLSHHWLDSTHITFGVVTTGVVHDDWKLEVSQFTGREPDRYRFDFDPARFDSTAARLSWNPGPHWALQASIGWLKSPEQLEPSTNEERYTASAMYVLPLGEAGSWSSMLAFGHKQLTGGTSLNAWLAETEYKPDDIWTIFARAESVETNELLPSSVVRTAGELSFGGIHDWRVAEHAKFGLGAQYTFDFTPAAGGYGSDPHGAIVFVRLNLE
jgi:hypothetical protein